MAVTITVIGSSSKGNCYQIDGSSRILIEVGIPWARIRQALRFSTSGIDGVLVSHEHGDHAKSVNDAIKAGLDVYISQGTAEALDVRGHRIHHIKSMQQFQFQNWKILPFDVVHDAAEPLGFLIQSGAGDKILFLTDTAYCKYRFKGITHLMIECNFSNEILERNIAEGIVDGARKYRLVRSHMSLERVLDFLKANDLSQLREIFLIHLSDHNSDEILFKKKIQEQTGIPVYVC